jgi:glycerophosphoryl diester phosphodiesterase
MFSTAAENTLDSFLGALAAGIQWVEVDVRRTPHKSESSPT